MDFFIDNTMKQAILELTNKDITPNRHTWNYWKDTTERMLKLMSVAEVVDMVLTISEGISDEDWNTKYPSEIFKEEKEKVQKKNIKCKGHYANLINNKIDIIKLAEKFGLTVKSNKCICPFHGDTDASLLFYPETNSFYCFGACRKGGDVIEFYRMMKELQNEKKGS